MGLSTEVVVSYIAQANVTYNFNNKVIVPFCKFIKMHIHFPYNYKDVL